METHLSPAIVLKTIPYGESDLLVFFFTPDHGRLKGIAKGAQRSRKRFVNCLDVFSFVRLEFSPRRTGEFHLLQSGRLMDGFPGLRRDFAILSYASFMVELTEVLFPAGVVEPEMFESLRGSLERLGRGGAGEEAVIVFEIRAMALGGFGIDFETCSICKRPYRNEGRAVFLCEAGGIACLGCRSESALRPGIGPEAARLIRRVQAGPWEVVREEKVTEEMAGEIRPVLRMHRNRRLERELRTSRFLER